MFSALAKFSLAALFIPCLAAIGCSAAGSGPEADEQEIRGGKICGGIAGLACPSGQSCVITDAHPDATGKCAVQAAKKGERCGGNVVGAKQCAAGLTCAGQNGGGIAGTPGTCE